MRETLYIAGAAAELFGILALAAPDVVPGLVRFGAWLTPRWQQVKRRVRLLLHLPVHATIYVDAADGIAFAEGSVEIRKSVNPDATLDEKVAFLPQRDQEAQRDVSALASQVAAVEEQTPRDLDALREEMRAHVGAELASSDAAHRTLRVLGAVALTVGLGLSTAANIVS